MCALRAFHSTASTAPPVFTGSYPGTVEREYFYTKKFDPSLVRLSHHLIGTSPDSKLTTHNCKTISQIQRYVAKCDLTAMSAPRTETMLDMGYDINVGSELQEWEFDARSTPNLLGGLFGRQFKNFNRPDPCFVKAWIDYVQLVRVPVWKKAFANCLAVMRSTRCRTPSEWAAKFEPAKRHKYIRCMMQHAVDPSPLYNSEAV